MYGINVSLSPMVVPDRTIWTHREKIKRIVAMINSDDLELIMEDGTVYYTNRSEVKYLEIPPPR